MFLSPNHGADIINRINTHRQKRRHAVKNVLVKLTNVIAADVAAQVRLELPHKVMSNKQ
jgi:hypothetical protein